MDEVLNSDVFGSAGRANRPGGAQHQTLIFNRYSGKVKLLKKYKPWKGL
jgi:hypothetical protein